MLDVDYHHGNGTQSIFYERADVLFQSIHGDPRTEYPFYLGHADETGRGAGVGYNRNYPLPAGSSNEGWFEALGAACARIRAHQPAALVVSLGVDTFAGDPISTFQLEAPSTSGSGGDWPGSSCRPCSSSKAATRWPKSATTLPRCWAAFDALEPRLMLPTLPLEQRGNGWHTPFAESIAPEVPAMESKLLEIRTR